MISDERFKEIYNSVMNPTMTEIRIIKVCPFCYSASISRRARYPRDYKCNSCKRTFKVPEIKESERNAPMPRYLRPKKEVIQ